MNIYVGNLNYKATEADLTNLFSQHGEVASARIIINKFNGRSKGYGFVEMPNDNEAKTAIEALAGTQFMERSLVAAEAKPKTENTDNNPQDTGNSF